MNAKVNKEASDGGIIYNYEVQQSQCKGIQVFQLSLSAIDPEGSEEPRIRRRSVASSVSMA